MNRVRVPFIATAAMLSMVACNRNDPVQPDASSTAGLPTSVERAPSAAGEPHGAPTVPAGVLPAAALTIPANLHGRWGLTPGDCMSARGDAKGLLIVSGDALRFYESRAVPGPDAEASEDSINGHFTFNGEGQTWTKYEAVRLQKDKLIRTESNPTASFSYAKCG
jgi:hypothetical protein